MKPSSISLWSIALLGAVTLPSVAAQAWWRDRYADDGYVIESYPPGYLRDHPVVVYPSRRHYDGAVIYTRRGRAVFVDPGYDEGSYYGELPSDEGWDVPHPRPPARVEAPRRPRDSQAATDPSVTGSTNGPVIVPGLAPRKAVGPKIVTAKPSGSEAAEDKAVSKPAPSSTVASAVVALPVPRPNLEGLDFAPDKPDVPAAQSDEGRR
jgi:hypothetical protein